MPPRTFPDIQIIRHSAYRFFCTFFDCRLPSLWVTSAVTSSPHFSGILPDPFYLLTARRLPAHISLVYLGVYISQYLSWSDHSHNLEMKLFQSVAMFCRVRYYLCNNALRSVYYSLTYSHLQYHMQLVSGLEWSCKSSFEATECFT